jgi:hypothetical protein
MGAVIYPLVAGYYSTEECSPMGPRAADIILPRNAAQWASAPRILFCRGMQPNGPARRGYYSAEECSPMGPRAAERLSYRMSAAIFLHYEGHDSAKFGSPMGPRAADRLSCQMSAAIFSQYCSPMCPRTAVMLNK